MKQSSVINIACAVGLAANCFCRRRDRLYPMSWRVGRPSVRLVSGRPVSSAANGISCHDCHGGDPTDYEMAMTPERGFAGTL